MRLTGFASTNFMVHGCLSLQFNPDANLILVSGHNGRGKSAITQGIEMALTGGVVRGLKHKKDLSELITQGESSGSVVVTAEVDGAEGTWKVNLRSGAQDGGALDAPAYSLNPRAFLALPAAERRNILFELAGAIPKPAEVKALLLEKGHAESHIERIYHHIRVGFPQAAEEAQKGATEARGAWRALTGEVHGTEKGEVWRSPRAETTVSSRDIAEVERKRADVAKLNSDLENAKATLGSARSAAGTWANVQGLRDQAAAVAEGKRTLADALQRQDMVQARIDRLQRDFAAAPVPKSGLTCPCCFVALKIVDGKLQEDIDPDETALAKPVDVAALRTELNTATAELASLKQSVSKAQRVVDTGTAAQETLSSLGKEPDPNAVSDATGAVAHAESAAAVARLDLQQTEAAISAFARNKELDAKALAHHRDVIGFSRLADALIAMPKDFSAEALATLNGICTRVSGCMDKPVLFGEDMEPRYGTIRYGLASEAEQRRVEFVIGYALATLTGLGVLLIDAFDDIDVPSRGRIFQFSHGQADVQVLLFATLKEKPNFPAPTQVIWL